MVGAWKSTRWTRDGPTLREQIHLLTVFGEERDAANPAAAAAQLFRGASVYAIRIGRRGSLASDGERFLGLSRPDLLAVFTMNWIFAFTMAGMRTRGHACARP